MKRTPLKVEKRNILGKKVKNLRREGLLPATLYGKDVKSVSLQVPLKEFEHVYKEAGETGLVDLTVESEKARPVFIKNVQLHPTESSPLHADFYQVNLSVKIKAIVPVESTGEPKAVLDKLGILENPLSEIEVECLPTDVPEKIEVDVTNLSGIGDQIKVGDMKVDGDVAVLTTPDQILFKIGELAKEEPEPVAAPAEGAEGAAPAEGEAPAAEGEKPAEGAKEAAKPEEKKE